MEVLAIVAAIALFTIGPALALALVYLAAWKAGAREIRLMSQNLPEHRRESWYQEQMDQLEKNMKRSIKKTAEED